MAEKWKRRQLRVQMDEFLFRATVLKAAEFVQEEAAAGRAAARHTRWSLLPPSGHNTLLTSYSLIFTPLTLYLVFHSSHQPIITKLRESCFYYEFLHLHRQYSVLYMYVHTHTYIHTVYTVCTESCGGGLWKTMFGFISSPDMLCLLYKNRPWTRFLQISVEPRADGGHGRT